MTASTRSVPTFDPRFTESINSEAARPPPQEEVPMDPIFVHSQREVEDFFRDMLPFFEGRECEENWPQRDKSITSIRRLTKGNATTDYYNVYMASIKQLQEGILKVANSLRTTTSTNACQLVQELARTLGPALDPMVEIYLQNFVKMCAATKNIAAQNGNYTVDTLLQYVSCNSHTIQHIWLATQDKNIQPRTFAATWLSTVLNRQTGSKSHFERSGGLELAEKILKKGLNDAQPKVKESMRGAYWTFAKIWPEKANAVMNTLDAKAKAALEKHPHNPNAPSVPASTSTSTLRASATSRAQSRASVRDAIMAARKNLGRSTTERPSSAMAAPTIQSPVRSKSSNNLSVRQPSASHTTSSRAPSNSSSTSKPAESTHSSASSLKPNSLMSGAARRPMRKPEPPRPATADPYASRRLLRPETPSNRSPANSPRHDTTASLARSAAASATRKKLESESPAATPARQYASPKSAIPSPKSSAASPRSISRPRPSSKDSRKSMPEEASFTKDEELTMVIPTTGRHTISPVAARHRPAIDQTFSVDSGIPMITGEEADTFPSDSASQNVQQPTSPILRRTPARSISEDAAHLQSPPSARSSARRPSDRGDAANSQKRAPSIPRQSSPLKTSTAAPPEYFQIHEDASNGREIASQVSSPTPQEPRVLNELPLNESNYFSHAARDSVQSPLQGDGVNQNGHVSPPMSPESKADTIRSRKLLMSGIERIKNHTLDPHGFRKVLELVRASDSGDVFGSVGEGRRFDDLYGALLDYMVASVEPTSGNVKHTQELKRQAITILRTLLNKQQSIYKKWVSSGRCCQRTLAGVFDARKSVEGSGLLVKDLETLTSEIVARVHPEEGQRAVLSWLDQNQDDHQSHHDGQQVEVVHPAQDMQNKGQVAATALALRTLSSLLGVNSNIPLLGEVSTRIAHVTAACLRSVDAEVRKAAVEVAMELHNVWPAAEDAASETKAEYWTLLEKSGVQESARNLIVYFIARRAKTA